MDLKDNLVLTPCHLFCFTSCELIYFSELKHLGKNSFCDYKYDWFGFLFAGFLFLKM